MSNVIIVDLESTCCDKDTISREEMEIIEIGAVWTQEGIVVDHFERFIKPKLNPQLTDFCKSLTTITQEQVDKALPFSEVVKEFNQWISINKRKYNAQVVEWASWGNYDKNQFIKDAKRTKCNVDLLKMKHFNIKDMFVKKYPKYKGSKQMSNIVEFLELDFIGTHHRGIDDAINIANIYQKLIK